MANVLRKSILRYIEIMFAIGRLSQTSDIYRVVTHNLLQPPHFIDIFSNFNFYGTKIEWLQFSSYELSGMID